jgi:hypothetical protein
VNKKDIAHIRRQFKRDNDLIRIFDILNVYILKESNEIYHEECRPFAMLDADHQELYLGNFKKLLSGSLDERLFELKFQREAEGPGEHTQLLLHQSLHSSDSQDWRQLMLLVVEKMIADAPLTEDTLVTFIRGEVFKPTKRRNEEAEVSERDEVYSHRFILCSINKTLQPEKSLMFDYVGKEFKYNVVVDPIIKLSSPEGGFLFPCFTDHAADVNHLLYSAAGATGLDEHFIHDVMNCELAVTAGEERAIFEEIVNEVAGNQLDTSTLAQVYEEIQRVIDENEEADAPRLDYRDVERVLAASGVEQVDTAKVERAFQNVVDDPSYEMKATNVIPKYTSKSIKINTKVATITVSPQDLKYVRQVNYKGKRCILIEVDEDAVIEGFTMNSEELF